MSPNQGLIKKVRTLEIQKSESKKQKAKFKKQNVKILKVLKTVSKN
jgi:hypothetical protein